MAAHLECLSEPTRGKHLPLSAAKPISIKTNKGDEQAGEIRIEEIEGTCVLTNRSRLQCTVNGISRARIALADGDVIQIGKQSFRLVVGDDDGASTQQLLPPEDVAPVVRRPVPVLVPQEPPRAPQFCSACDSVFGSMDRDQGWSEGERRICRSCLAKGVRPDNLPRTAAKAPGHESTVSAAPAREIVSASDPSEPAGKSDSDRQRRQRRLSASRLAKVDEGPTRSPSLLSKVGAVFGNREERKRLDILEQERLALLLEAGRHALSDPGYGGLPEHCLAPILKGVAINVRLQDLNISALERWRGQRERLAHLDAEIAALRAGLSLGPDPAVKPGLEPLRGEQLARQNRTFATLDGIATQDLSGEIADEAEADEVTGPPVRSDSTTSAGARRKGSGRRKR
ncbi:MAG: FHA domain-containing protein [Planctomycetes bacterium]|nr:FHA domain-containing protein [Planctomycetota bacterium]